MDVSAICVVYLVFLVKEEREGERGREREGKGKRKREGKREGERERIEI